MCTAGFKAIRQDDAYPSRDYLVELGGEGFAAFIDKIDGPLAQLGTAAGTLTAEAASWTGLPEGIAVAVGNVDAHVTVPAARATEPGHLLAVMGTSTCHVMNGEDVASVPGMCGVVRDGITPGSWGYEAGQSGVGDIFGWFVEHSVPPSYHEAARKDAARTCTSTSRRSRRSSRSVSTDSSRSTGTAATGRRSSTTGSAA